MAKWSAADRGELINIMKHFARGRCTHAAANEMSNATLMLDHKALVSLSVFAQTASRKLMTLARHTFQLPVDKGTSVHAHCAVPEALRAIARCEHNSANAHVPCHAKDTQQCDETSQCFN